MILILYSHTNRYLTRHLVAFSLWRMENVSNQRALINSCLCTKLSFCFLYTSTHCWQQSTHWDPLPLAAWLPASGYHCPVWPQRVSEAHTGGSPPGCSSWAWRSWMSDFHCKETNAGELSSCLCTTRDKWDFLKGLRGSRHCTWASTCDDPSCLVCAIDSSRKYLWWPSITVMLMSSLYACSDLFSGWQVGDCVVYIPATNSKRQQWECKQQFVRILVD